jgi:hypothetical protein
VHDLPANKSCFQAARMRLRYNFRALGTRYGKASCGSLEAPWCEVSTTSISIPAWRNIYHEWKRTSKICNITRSPGDKSASNWYTLQTQSFQIRGAFLRPPAGLIKTMIFFKKLRDQRCLHSASHLVCMKLGVVL